MTAESTYDTTTAADDAQDGTQEQGGVMSAVQGAAETVRSAAETAADRLPDAMLNAQVAVDDTARVLNDLPNQALMVGTSFSLGLGAGLFLSGSNRLLVMLALVPAGAMAVTLLGRDNATQG